MGPDVQNKYLRLLLHDQSGVAAPGRRRCHRQYRFDYRSGGQQTTARLCFDKSRNSRFHKIVGAESGGAWNSSELRCARTSLDAAESRGQESGRRGPVWGRHADEAACTTGRDRAGFCLFRFGDRFKLCHWRGLDVTRRRDNRGLSCAGLGRSKLNEEEKRWLTMELVLRTPE